MIATSFIQISQESAPKLADSFEEGLSTINDINLAFAEDMTSDQQDWFDAVRLNLSRIVEVLRSTGTGNIPEGEEWNTARQWADIYLALFLLIDRGFQYIKPVLKKKLSPGAALSPNLLMVEIIKGHSLFWANCCCEGNYTFSVAATRDAMRKLRKLDSLEAPQRERAYKKVSKYVGDRFGSANFEFFAPHTVCVMICRQSAKKDKSLKPWLDLYDGFMDVKSKKLINDLREGKAQGFGFRAGIRLTSAPGGSYKP
ncbi:MAG: hypothetical protein KME11_12550 [Timaviella obliquedivisa GSE-PSE-MK23-08B]|jgi:hypothetical protein|nr:hypothetical protein [Timaviella obliquedivisa GSE-PSE-MK23-08B]